jgi:hypothetical protein
MDNKLIDIYENDAVVAADVRIIDSDVIDGDPAVLMDMVRKEVVVEIPNLKPEDAITIMGKKNGAKVGKGRFFSTRCR